MTPDVQVCLDCAMLQKIVVICTVVLVAVILFIALIVLGARQGNNDNEWGGKQ